MPPILIFLSGLAAASSIHPETPSRNPTSLRADSSSAKLLLHRASVAGSITEAEIQRVRGECKESCPNLPYGKYQCCVPECAMKTYECRDSACEKEVLNYVKKKYIPPEKQKETFRGWSSWLNRTNSNTSVKVQGGHHFTDAEIQETHKSCMSACHEWKEYVELRDKCCVNKCKVDIYECHVDQSEYETCKEGILAKHDGNTRPLVGF
eukprot:gnl/TRDRNA2_/TRDRNA2_175042_c1_seq51.p1 gnl/TRDRNA2_/TRDRNA2_175042_c1~~gnl/TRDRNA2_/TRDRNA2_175042_c1_seq51.p1  ORF type:complete len:208 (-),score=25.94 gnl/TRDRNA2_/TRDRNA2_175042_c1_seq51:37-660(-)